jgi:hypothetical protein
MNNLFLFRRSALSAFAVMALAIVSANSNATSIQLNPGLPVPGDAVNVSIAFNACARFDRWERSENRIVVYANRANFSPCPGGGTTEIALGALNAGNHAIEVFERITGEPSPPDGYTKTAERRFTIAFGRPRAGKASQISIIGSISKIQSPSSGSVITFTVKDAAGTAIPDAPLGLSAVAVGPISLGAACEPFRISNDCRGYQTNANGALTFPAPVPSDAEGAVITTVIGSTIVDTSVLSAYATIGYIDSLRRDIVMPVVEYEIDASVVALPTRYFLSADDATSLALDNLPGIFRRTYAAFFGVKPNTPGAVPVCRFFAGGKNGAPLTHVFTADIADCAAKKADTRYTDEGVTFWAYPSGATGSCPRDTRGVTRYKLTYGTNTADIAFRYSTLLSMRNQAALGGANASGVSVTNDGVAFCVPD